MSQTPTVITSWVHKSQTPVRSGDYFVYGDAKRVLGMELAV